MKRHCNGKDWTWMFIDWETKKRVDDPDLDLNLVVTSPPCDCGLEFDDTERSTVYPHKALP